MATLGHRMVRYADDFVVLCKSRAEAEEALAAISRWVAENGLIPVRADCDSLRVTRGIPKSAKV
jgi:hypothetical protein